MDSEVQISFIFHTFILQIFKFLFSLHFWMFLVSLPETSGTSRNKGWSERSYSTSGVRWLKIHLVHTLMNLVGLLGLSYNFKILYRIFPVKQNRPSRPVDEIQNGDVNLIPVQSAASNDLLASCNGLQFCNFFLKALTLISFEIASLIINSIVITLCFSRIKLWITSMWALLFHFN